MADVYSAFALAFKKPAGIPKEAFFFEVSLEIRENQDSDAYGAVGADGSNYDSVPRQKNMFKLKRDVDKKVVITVSQVSKVGKVLLYDFSRHADNHVVLFSLFDVEQYCEVDGGALLRSAGVSRPKRPPC